MVQKAPIHQSHIYKQIKILRTIFEKGYPRNIIVKLFQNLTSSFGEENLLRISSCPYSARSPHSPEPCLWTDQNFANNFWKGSPKEHSCEIISKSDQQFQRRRFFKNFFMSPIVREAPIHQSHVYGRIKISRTIFEEVHQRNIPVKLFQNLISSFGEEDFLRISSCPYSVRNSHLPQPCFWGDQNFVTNFLKGSPKEHSCETISKSDKQFQRRRFLKNCLKNSISLPWKPELLMESNSVNNFWRGSPKEHSCQVWSKLAQWFGRRRCLKKLLTTHNGRRTPCHPKISPWAHCAQVS